MVNPDENKDEDIAEGFEEELVDEPEDPETISGESDEELVDEPEEPGEHEEIGEPEGEVDESGESELPDEMESSDDTSDKDDIPEPISEEEFKENTGDGSEDMDFDPDIDSGTRETTGIKHLLADENLFEQSGFTARMKELDGWWDEWEKKFNDLIGKWS